MMPSEGICWTTCEHAEAYDPPYYPHSPAPGVRDVLLVGRVRVRVLVVRVRVKGLPTSGGRRDTSLSHTPTGADGARKRLILILLFY